MGFFLDVAFFVAGVFFFVADFLAGDFFVPVDVVFFFVMMVILIVKCLPYLYKKIGFVLECRSMIRDSCLVNRSLFGLMKGWMGY